MNEHISYNDNFVKITRFDDMPDNAAAKDISLKGFEPSYYITYGEAYKTLAEHIAYTLDVDIVLHIENLQTFIVFGEAQPPMKMLYLESGRE